MGEGREKADRTDLSGRAVLLTGGGAGIGRAIALTLAEHGAHVAIVDRARDRIDAVIEEIAATKGSAVGVTVDITDESSINSAVAAVAKGGAGIDVLINCAGIYDELKSAHGTPTDLWRRVFAVNLDAAFMLIRAVLPYMQKAASGSIINIASVSGIRGGSGGAAYTASKHGLIGLTRSVAWSYAQEGIRCNALCPGAIGDTRIMDDTALDPVNAARCMPVMSLAGEPGRPSSIADAALFLASDQSSFVNGVVLPVDGGWSAG
ncbi:NAD(P)-dependent dehydrogenase (short-subunit alcohol dehydrogenase family) [Sphingobium xenophagum]|uniref:NAD(P)-dependent dehydrogenase (Short-subunit alcohol dehydrogenase family) n=1 Tax=Sphingobium xenophagum TaxID=121428 RepID=A0ABU1X4E0_SPHXE|nr:SDR family NAD(P)-dependent oxidoreductase [Sphingobium xenophagum]MDR7156460.1 NAD(P)-dependent dehydrogenase (short-subunit alcohol dehydrogenase family) [Sphingobium xenophagum]